MRLATSASILFATACSSRAPSVIVTPTPIFAPAGSAATPAPAAVKVSLSDVGLEPGSLDRTTDPCVDFYQFSCGGWLQTNQIPSDRARWGRFAEIDDRNKAAIKSLLEDDAKAIGPDPTSKKLGDYYASCMDEAAIEKAGTASIRSLLDKTQKVNDAKSWSAALTELHKAGIRVVWEASAAPDLRASTTNVTYLDAAALGLPDRDYYVKPELKDKLDAYKTHVAKMLALTGMAQPKAEVEAAEVVAIETELAKLTKTAAEKRDVQASYNPTDLKGLARQVKSVDWKAYWKALDVTPSAQIVIGSPKLFGALDGVRGKFKPAQWSSYFTFRVLEAHAFSLPKPFDDEVFELQRVLTGVEKQRERYKRCIDATQSALGELLGLQYVTKYFPGSSKQTAVKLVDALARALGEEIGKLDWMTDATRSAAEAKLANVVRMIGFPDKWKTYDFDVKRDDFGGNELRATAYEAHRILAKAGKPVDRSEWQMNTYTVNAYYEPTANSAALPAGILQPPFFGADRSVAANLGGIGMLIGHELTHGFDDQGAQFDSEGNLKNWWQKTDRDKFDAKGQCVADMYSTFEASQKAFVNGKLTLGENIADLGGVKIAYKAYRTLRKDADKVSVADGFTEDQQFFIAVGQAWCDKDRPEEVKRRLAIDPHAPPKFRVYGALRNLPEFAQAFSCAPGTPMRPANTCTVW